ncbi:YutD family protein [Lactobacillus corticis]|uniref:Transcriptional regulator n=1 Tax=Lactobacillus corticis TaxID=2201249 RepID=A0A916QK44_9LACO|nr:YutD family protein [Lactobacillus corticis]GFZ27342.1 transcriptional regulator [Lactobacillus corticis]
MSEATETNKFAQAQPLRHPKAVVAQQGEKIKINNQTYRLAVNHGTALDLEMLALKYDPYLDQYDFIVGDVSSEHLRLKGFYKKEAHRAIDKSEYAIADYLTEYCNPGTAYFILELLDPVHTYHPHKRKKFHYAKHKPSRQSKTYRDRKQRNRTKFKKHPSRPRRNAGRHKFTIKKREAH